MFSNAKSSFKRRKGRSSATERILTTKTRGKSDIDLDTELINQLYENASYDHKLCVEMLQEGSIDSFIEFFEFTHPQPPCIGSHEVHVPEGEKPIMHNSKELRDCLITLENASFSGDELLVQEAYDTISNYFLRLSMNLSENQSKLVIEQRLMYLEQQLNHARDNGYPMHEGRVLQTIGSIYKSLSMYDEAISFYTDSCTCYISIQQDHSVLSELSENYTVLIEIFGILTENAFKSNQLLEALNFQTTIIEFAEKLSDERVLLKNLHKLGRYYYLTKQYQNAIDAFKKELIIGRKLKMQGDHTGDEAIALAAAGLAEVYYDSQQQQRAMKYLMLTYKFAIQSKKPGILSQSCADIGRVYRRKGTDDSLSSAISFYEKHFALSLREKNQSEIDRARIQIGLTQGDAVFEEFMAGVQTQQFKIPETSQSEVRVDHDALAQLDNTDVTLDDCSDVEWEDC
ncbi:hypothetical protein PCE1_003300 [Barthelona sp. PCE]